MKKASIEKKLIAIDYFSSRKPKGKVVLVGGCFDLLHAGHVDLFEKAKEFGDKLLVVVLSDKYIQSYKGINRPIIDQENRIKSVAAIEAVDYVMVLDCDPYGIEIIKQLKADVVIIGNEKDKEEKKKKIVDSIKESIPAVEIILLDRFDPESISTSKIISKIKSL